MYKALRTALYANDIDYKQLGQQIGKKSGYISQRMTAKKAWTLDDVYNICTLLEIPLEEISKYFPKDRK